MLVRLRVGLNYSPQNLVLMLTIYALAALPFFTGGLVVTLAISRLSARINAVYAADLIGAAAGCLVLIPLLDRLGAPGVVLTAAALALRRGRAVRAAARAARVRRRRRASSWLVPLAGQLSGVAGFDVVDTKGHSGDRVLFSKWNSFSRIGVYERTHGDWSLSPPTTGRCPTRGSWTSTRRRRRRSCTSTPDLVERAVPALRADGAGVSPEGSSIGAGSRPSPRLHRAGHRPGRRTRPRVGAGLRRARTSTASRSTRSSPTT